MRLVNLSVVASLIGGSSSVGFVYYLLSGVQVRMSVSCSQI